MEQYTVLYAEDEEQTRLNYTNYLQRYFKNVYSAKDGKEALELYTKYNPDILLLDINMPKINGLNVAKTIRETNSQTRIIILTAHLEQDKLLFATELNLTKYIAKPISRDELKDTLNRAISQLKEMKKDKNLIYFSKELFWDKNEQILKNDDTKIKLTKYEILFLELLSSKENRVFSLDDISSHLWNDIYEDTINSNRLKDMIKRLRKKLPKNSIENIYGAGFKLNHI